MSSGSTPPLPPRTSPPAPINERWMETYFSKYAADEVKQAEFKKSNDGLQTCDAVIWYKDRSGDTHTFKGQTGTGHAEMNALSKLFESFDALAAKIVLKDLIDGQALIQVECLTKPCCFRCSVVLGVFHASAKGKTFKVPKSMGSTQWGGLSSKLKSVLHSKDICDLLQLPYPSSTGAGRDGWIDQLAKFTPK